MVTAAVFRPLMISMLATLGVPIAVADQMNPRSEFQRDIAEGDRTAKADLMSVMDDVSTLATKTRMNADYVPGILTLLDGEELVALGVHTVWDALELVPGVQIERNNNGGLLVAIRGFRHGNGNVKLLLNSAPMNNAFGGYSNILYLPVEQVDRIEVIRGPGSALHGEHAFAGVINVITRKDENRVYLRAGSGSSRGAGIVSSISDPDADWWVSLNAAGWDTQGTGPMAGTDWFYGVGDGDLSQAPGRINSAENARMAVLSVDYGRLSLLAQYSRSRGGTFFGALNVLPEPSEGANASDAEQTLIQMGRTFEPTETLDAELKFTWSEFIGDWAEQVLPPGVSYPRGSRIIYPDGIYMEDYVRVGRREAELSLDWSGWAGHRWQLYLSAAQIRIEDAWWSFNGDLDTGYPLAMPRRYGGDRNFIEEGASRSIRSVAVQDQFHLFEPLELTLGLRHDSYSDVGDNLSPRLAAVWTLTEEHLLKAQYAEAFFPPTLYQVYGLRVSMAHGEFVIDPETVATSELGYIFRRGTSVGRVTLYHSEVENLIVIESSSYINRGRGCLQGIETEWEQRLSPSWKLQANLSYTETLDKEIGGPLPGVADWLGNLSLFYRPSPDLLVTGHWRYVGDRHRSTDDPRTDPLRGYQDLSLTLNWFNLGTPGMTLRAGVDNLLEQRIKSPAAAYTYADDYPLLDERTWWMQVSYQWQ